MQYYSIGSVTPAGTTIWYISEVRTYLFWQNGRTPLHIASEGDKIDIVQLLLEKMAFSNIHSVDGVSGYILYECFLVTY